MHYEAFRAKVEGELFTLRRRDAAHGIHVLRAIGKVPEHANIQATIMWWRPVVQLAAPFVAVASSHSDAVRTRPYDVYVGNSDPDGADVWVRHGARHRALVAETTREEHARLLHVQAEFPGYVALAGLRQSLGIDRISYIEGTPNTLEVNGTPTMSGEMCRVHESLNLALLTSSQGR
ncbi:MAG TPA: hypothetical protein VLE73_03825 [Candidatus Saccharimonadales bacterium]|nr:hypothetical protein [Candidatus Saccharimonadales bacterium]